MDTERIFIKWVAAKFKWHKTENVRTT